MSTLDSRLLRTGDCYAHRFSTPGVFRYELSPLPVSLAVHEDEEPVRVVVVSAATDKAQQQKQHDVVVKQTGNTLMVEPTRIDAVAGDLVVWAGDKSVAQGFRVRGQLGDQVIDSSALRDESIFTHAFGLAGEYEWVDANGSGLGGEIQVSLPDATTFDQDQWLATLEQGSLINVKGQRATPRKVEIIVGQTVVWAVEKAPGVSITDRSLLGVATPTNR
jgi:plastocyanin